MESSEEIKVLVIGSNNDLRLFPDSLPIMRSGDRTYRFYLEANDELEPDIVVVRNKTLKTPTTFRVARENTILVLSEPKSIVRFSKRYTEQFGLVYSCQDTMRHRNIVYGNAALGWYVGIAFKGGKAVTQMNYNDIHDNPLPAKKKLISVITSNKAFTKGHQERIDFVSKLKAHYGDKLDVYGRGFREFEDKWNVLADYKYHIAIENSSSKYYWTEKLSDSYLAGCYPIYYGCTNIGDYFAKDAFSSIDIHDFDGAVDIIDGLLASDQYTQSQGALLEAREKVMAEYNMFRIIANCCDKLDLSRPKENVTLRPLKSLSEIPNTFARELERIYYKTKFCLFGKKL